MDWLEKLNLLEEIYATLNAEAFIAQDPIQIPKFFQRKEDIEISAFLTSTIAWGNRKQIVQNAQTLMNLMNHQPFDCIMSLSPKDLNVFSSFKHRTFNGNDVFTLCLALKQAYKSDGGLFALFYEPYARTRNLKDSLANLFKVLSLYTNNYHTMKHIGNVSKNSAAKRLNLFLRWMVRKDEKNIDIGIWNDISTADLYIPLDVHVSCSARKLKLLQRKQNDWKAVEELTQSLKRMHPEDPIKYDFSLFLYNTICSCDKR